LGSVDVCSAHRVAWVMPVLGAGGNPGTPPDSDDAFSRDQQNSAMSSPDSCDTVRQPTGNTGRVHDLPEFNESLGLWTHEYG